MAARFVFPLVNRAKSFPETGIPSALTLFSLQAKQPTKRVTGLNQQTGCLAVSVEINCVLSVERRKKSPIAAFERLEEEFLTT
jgi:hypothetical protein